MKRFFLVALIPLLLSCVSQEKVQRAELIAHAGGAIDGYVYTNSREALERAVANGYTFIEFDLIFTSDSVLVAAHSWSDFNRITGHKEWGDSVPTFADFAGRRIHGRYTPLSAAEINTYFSDNDRLFLVTDKESSPEVLATYFPHLKERMVVEAFSYEHYCRLIDEGYFRVLYSCMANDIYSALPKNLLFDKLFPGRRIEWIALHTSGFNNSFFKFLDSVRRFRIALFTLDNYDDIPNENVERASMIYTNTMLPNGD